MKIDDVMNSTKYQDFSAQNLGASARRFIDLNPIESCIKRKVIMHKPENVKKLKMTRPRSHYNTGCLIS